MNIFALIGLALVMCVLVITVGQLKPEMSLLLSIACGVVLTCFLLKYALPWMDVPILWEDGEMGICFHLILYACA